MSSERSSSMHGDPPIVLPAPGTATAATRAIHARIAERLPLDEPTDFENARRGLIAQVEGGVIRDADGRVVVDVAEYGFLDGPVPDTVNPSLWRQARLNGIHGLFEVVDGIYQVRGYDIAAMSFIRGKSGWIIVDPLLTRETAQAALELVRTHVADLRVSAVLVTHSHMDHFGGIRGILSEEQVAEDGVRIIAPEGFTEHVMSALVIAGNHMTRRSMYQFGLLLPRHPAGLVDAGIGKEAARGTRTFMSPTDFVSTTGEAQTIDGVEFIFQIASGSEAPAEFTFYLPDFKALCMSEVACMTMHNILTLRGAEVRDPLLWAGCIDEALGLYGAQAEVVFACHNWPEWGNENVRRHLREQRDIYKYIHDQTLRLANHGYTPLEIAEQVEEPRFLANSFGVRGYYGTLDHNIKATYQRYFGYFDGNPANLQPLPPAEEAARYVALAGGPERMLQHAWRAFGEGDYRWAATLLKHLVFGDPDHDQARRMLASVYEQLGFQAESTIWRNIYLTGAIELREGVRKKRGGAGINQDIVAAMPLADCFGLLGVRLNPSKAEGVHLKVNFHIDDAGEQVALETAACVTNHRIGELHDEPHLTVRLGHAELVGMAFGRLAVGEKMASGELAVEGDRDLFARFLEMHDDFELWFDIVTP